MQEYELIYLPYMRKNLKSDVELYEFLKKSFPEIKATSVRGSYFSFVFSLLAHVCYPLSVTAVSTVLGEYIRSNPSRVKKNRLMDRGALKSCQFKSYDMGVKNAYYLTPQGSESLFAFLPSYLCIKTKVRRTGGAVPIHDYGTGLSLLQCMLRQIPFSYSKELCYSSNLYKDRGALCVDAVVYFQDKDSNTLYIEQDMGTEPAETLVKKLYNYDRFGLTHDKNKVLVFSSHSISDYATCYSFNMSALNDLKADMIARGEDSVFSYYIKHKKELSERLGATARALLVRTGVCYCNNSNGEQVEAAEVTERHYLNRVNGVEDFALADLDKYLYDLKEGCNEYRLIDYNKHQMDISQGKLRKMAEIIIRRISLGQYDMKEVRCILNGFSCYVVPTVLMSNYFDIMFGERVEEIRYSLSPYFSSMEAAVFSDYSAPISFEGYPAFCLKNAFSLTDGSKVCVEHIGKDMGGYVRAYFLRLLQLAGAVLNIHLVCICDTDKEAMDFASLLQYHRNNRKMDAGVVFSFLLSRDIGKKDSLKVPCLLGGGGLILLKPLYDVPERKKSSVQPDTATIQSTESSRKCDLADTDVFGSAPNNNCDLESLSVAELNRLLGMK